jgi:putative lipoprotein
MHTKVYETYPAKGACSVKKSSYVKVALISGIFAVITTAVGCAHKQPDPMNTVTGTITYREQVKLSRDAVAYVTLTDVTDGRVNSKTVTQRVIHPDGAVPIPFELTYNEKRINPNREYVVDVRVVDRGDLVFVTDHNYRVMTKGNANNIEMTIERPGNHITQVVGVGRD